jgi:predicted phage-related endonuclease
VGRAECQCFLKDEFGVMPNDWLISSAVSDHYMATPDGLTLGHKAISEVKTTGKDWNPERIPVQYRRQVQWQLFVTDAEFCYFRVDAHERNVTALLFQDGSNLR